MATSPSKAPYRDIKVGNDIYRVYPDGRMKNLTASKTQAQSNANATATAKAKAAAALAAAKAKTTPTTAGGTPAAAGAAAVATAAPQQKRVDPFSTGAEMQNAAQFLGSAASQIAGYDQALAEMQADALPQLGYTDANGVYHQGSIDKGALQSSTSVTDQSGARGVGRSSIRDGALYDIEAQRVIQRGYLEGRIERARTNAATNKRIVENTVEGYNKGLVSQQAANAVAVNNTIEPYAPPAAQVPAVVAPAAAAQQSAKPAAATKIAAGSSAAPTVTLTGTKPIYTSAAWAGAARAAAAAQKKPRLGSGIGGK